MKKFTLLLALSLNFFAGYGQCDSVAVRELVKNGDFELGYLSYDPNDSSKHDHSSNANLEFYSDLKFVGNSPGAKHSLCSYSIGDNYGVGKRENFTCGGQSYVNNFYWGLGYGGDKNFFDHTVGQNGGGHALFVDELMTNTSSKTGGDVILWEQKTAVTTGVKYFFSCYTRRMAQVVSGEILSLVVVPIENGQPDESNKVVSGTGAINSMISWNQISGTWTSNTDSIYIRIEMSKAGTGSQSNDIFIDDISFINSCHKIETNNPKAYAFASNSIGICSAGGLVQASIQDSSGTTTNNSNKKIQWYTGKGNVQTEIDSVVNKTNPSFTQSGEYRACIMDQGNAACATNLTLNIEDGIDIKINDVTLCENRYDTVTTIITSASLALDTPSWVSPSGITSKAFSLIVEPKDSGMWIFRTNFNEGYRCKNTSAFNVKSKIAVAASPHESEVKFCTNGHNILLNAPNNKEYAWSHNEDLTDVVGTSTTVNMPDIGKSNYFVYFAPTEKTTIGILNPDTNKLTTITTDAKETFTVLKSGISLKEVAVKFYTWSIGCQGNGSKINSYIVLEGPTYDSIPYEFTCGKLTTVNINKKLAIGDYTIRTAKGSNLYGEGNWNRTNDSIAGIVIQKNGESRAFGDMKFEKSYACVAGRTNAIGEECAITNTNRIKETIQVYPNPSSSIFNFSSTLSLITVFNSQGKIIIKKYNANSINLSAYPKGLYLLQTNGISYRLIKK